jgi:zinc transport system permease protein
MLQYEFMQHALFVSICISLLCPCIGIFMVLRRCSMIGDTMSHASLAGITLGLLVHKNPIIGAFLFTSACGALIEFLRKYFPRHLDLILTIILSLSIGTAITLISSGRLHTNAEAFLFGSILTVNHTDMLCIFLLTILSIFILYSLYNSLLYMAYDEETARIAGVKVDLINYAFAVLMAAAVSISIKIVGVMVLSSMIALPVATALQLKKGFQKTLFYAVLFSFMNMQLGLWGSYYLKVAPGGFTSLMSVFLLLLILLLKKVVHTHFAGRSTLDFTRNPSYDKVNKANRQGGKSFVHNILACQHKTNQTTRNNFGYIKKECQAHDGS